MPCKHDCPKAKALDKLISELRNATNEGQCHQYLMGIIIAIEILRED
jgi:hypothetical protein